MTFATPADYAEFSGMLNPQAPTLPNTYYDQAGREAARAKIVAGLDKAEDDIRGYLTNAVYAVDTDGNATNPGVIKALTRATCAQLEFTQSTGDDTGAGALFDSTRIGPVSLTRSTSQAAGNAPKSADVLVSPRALTILTNAGLRPFAVAVVI